jgi:hypothetical protein
MSGREDKFLALPPERVAQACSFIVLSCMRVCFSILRAISPHSTLQRHGFPEEGSLEGASLAIQLGSYLTGFQVIILGDSGVGKTSLMNQYV